MSHQCDGLNLSCLGCAALARRHDTVRAAMTLDDQLDDIKRARIWAQLDDTLANPAAPHRSRWPLAIGLAAMASAAAIVLVARSPQLDEPHTLSVPVDTTVTSHLGPHTSAALVGPAQLDLIGAAGDATAVRLRSGTLLAEFAGGPGRSLRIEAPGALVEVVGTLFAVEVRDARTCTSVAHGKVRVTTSAGTVHVTGGQRYCAGDTLRPIPSELRDALERHQAVITAQAESPKASPTTPSSAAPPTTPRVLDPPPARHPSSDPSKSSIATSSQAPSPRSAPIVAQNPIPVPSSPRSPANAAPRVQPPLASTPIPSSPNPRSIDPASSPNPAPRTADTPRPSLIDPFPASPTTSPRTIDPPLSSPSPRTTGPAPRAPTTSPRTINPPLSSPSPRTIEPPAKPTAAELYRTAETALAARDPADADRALATLLADYPGSPLVDQALYDRARIAYQQRAWATARRHLDRLAALPGTLLAEPGHYLTCRIAIEAHDGEAATCLADYRKAFPRSPHDLEALALLVQLAHARAGCKTAASLIDELVNTHPHATLAAAWRARCPVSR